MTQTDAGRQWFKDYQGGAFFGPYADSAAALAQLHADGKLYTMQENRPVAVPPFVELLPLVNAVMRHFTHAEAKAERPHGAGNVGVRRVRLSAIELIGKETSRAALPTIEESDGLLGMTGEDDEAQVYGPDSAAFGDSRDFRALLKGYTLTDLLLVTGVPERTLSKIRGGQTKEPDPATVRAILSGLPLLDPANPDTILGWRKEVPNATLARALRVARGDIDEGSPTGDELVSIREVKSGKRHLPEDERLALIAAIQSYQRERREEDDDTPSSGPTTSTIASVIHSRHIHVSRNMHLTGCVKGDPQCVRLLIDERRASFSLERDWLSMHRVTSLFSALALCALVVLFAGCGVPGAASAATATSTIAPTPTPILNAAYTSTDGVYMLNYPGSWTVEAADSSFDIWYCRDRQ